MEQANPNSTYYSGWLAWMLCEAYRFEATRRK